MTPNDMISDKMGKVYSDQDALALWPSGRAELLGFAVALDRGGSSITAAQIRLAVQLADKQFTLLKEITS